MQGSILQPALDAQRSSITLLLPANLVRLSFRIVDAETNTMKCRESLACRYAAIGDGCLIVYTLCEMLWAENRLYGSMVTNPLLVSSSSKRRRQYHTTTHRHQARKNSNFTHFFYFTRFSYRTMVERASYHATPR